MLTRGIVQNYNQPAFKAKISPKLQQVLKNEASSCQKKHVDKIKYQISKVKDWGREGTILDVINTDQYPQPLIILRNPKISRRLFVGLISNNRLSDAFVSIKEKTIKYCEKELINLACKIDN